MKSFFKTKQHVIAHARRVKILLAKGWTSSNGDWTSPYSGLRYTESLAICVEELRGTFKQGYAREWD